MDRENIQPIVDQLLTHLAPPRDPAPQSAMASLAAAAGGDSGDPSSTARDISISPGYRLLLAQRLLDIIAHDTYADVDDFEWVISVLVDVAYVSRVDVGRRIYDMLLDVVGRVKSARGYAVQVLEKVLGDEDLRERARDGGSESGLLEAAVWICGEYASNLASPLSAMTSILSPTLPQASPQLVVVSVQAAAKVFAYYAASASESWSADLHEETKNVVESTTRGLEPFLSSPDIEVQERAFELSQLLAFVSADLKNHVPPQRPDIPGVEDGFGDDSNEPPYPKSLFLFQPLFNSHELNSLAYRAQEAVRIPDDLNLDADIVPNAFGADLEDEDSVEEVEIDLGEGGGEGMDELRRVLRSQDKKGKKKETPEERAERRKRRAERREKLKNDPYYLYDEKDDVDVDDIPIVRLDDEELGHGESMGRQTLTAVPDRAPAVKSAKPKKKVPRPEFDRTGEMPEGSTPAPDIPSAPVSGLAAVDLTASSPAVSAVHRYEEYTLGDEETQSSTPGHNSAAERQDADTPADEVQAVKVTKVRRKKRKDK